MGSGGDESVVADGTAGAPTSATAAQPLTTPVRKAERAGRASRRPARRAPFGFVPLATVALLFIALPLVGLVARTPWRELPTDLAAPGILTALRLSLICSVAAVALSTVVGVPLAWVLARVQFRGRNVVRALVVLPMVLPPVVGGVALLLAFGRHGLFGAWLDRAFGVTLPFTTGGAIMAETFVAMPFLIVTVEAGLRALGQRYEDAAATLGAGRWMTFRRVTVPLIAPSLGAGAALAWARALGEFGATITFAGNLPGRTQTMPLAVYLALENNLGGAMALSLVMLVISLAVLVALRGHWFHSR